MSSLRRRGCCRRIVSRLRALAAEPANQPANDNDDRDDRDSDKYFCKLLRISIQLRKHIPQFAAASNFFSAGVQT